MPCRPPSRTLDRDALPDLGSTFNEDLVWRHHLACLLADGRDVPAGIDAEVPLRTCVLEPTGRCTVIDVAALTAPVRDGFIPANVYNDAEVFALERDRLFSTAWVFVAHESEIPGRATTSSAGSSTTPSSSPATTTVGCASLFNMCLHRGMQVCRAEAGHASLFRCPYHAWTYRNDGRLAGLPFHDDAYGGERRASSRTARRCCPRRRSAPSTA